MNLEQYIGFLTVCSITFFHRFGGIPGCCSWPVRYGLWRDMVRHTTPIRATVIADVAHWEALWLLDTLFTGTYYTSDLTSSCLRWYMVTLMSYQYLDKQILHEYYPKTHVTMMYFNMISRTANNNSRCMDWHWYNQHESCVIWAYWMIHMYSVLVYKLSNSTLHSHTIW